MNSFSEFAKLIRNPLKYRLFLLTKLPAAYFAGLHIISVDESACRTSVSYKWFNTNPFHSIYFAVLSMAAELSTGALCMGHVYKKEPAVSMLVVKVNSTYHKKAVGKIVFECNDGERIRQVIENAINNNDAVSIDCVSRGYNRNKELVAEFIITWSFKAKNK